MIQPSLAGLRLCLGPYPGTNVPGYFQSRLSALQIIRMCTEESILDLGAREVAPHLSAGFSNLVLSDIDAEVFPKSTEGAKWFLRAVVFCQGIHKRQDFLLLLGRKLTKPVNELFFNSHKTCAYDSKPLGLLLITEQ